MSVTTAYSYLSSLSAFSSASSDAVAANTTARRTRRRFSRDQVIILETKFRATAHPTREEREVVAKQIGMDMRSVTIWFQNKRQTERKIIFSDTTNRSVTRVDNHKGGGSGLLRMHSMPLPESSNLSRSISTATRAGPKRNTSVPVTVPVPMRPSLDRVASCSELPTTRLRTPPPKLRRQASALWENMQSSPIQPNSPVASPLALSRDYVAMFKGQSRKSLEWACAAARIAEVSGRGVERQGDDLDDILMKGDDQETVTEIDDNESMTEDDEVHEIDTPEGSMRTLDLNPVGYSAMPAMGKELMKIVEAGSGAGVVRIVEDDVMEAAWALCGLSRRLSQ